jgi:hypothetical protein
MTAARRLVAGTALLVAAGAAAAGTDHPVAGRTSLRPSSVATVRSSLVCPWTAGSSAAPVTTTVVDAGRLVHGAGAAAPTITTRRLAQGAAPSTLTAPVTVQRSTTPAAAVEVLASGPGADAVAAQQQRLIAAGPQRALSSAACLRPATDTWITGADGRIGRSDALALANPGSTDANLTVTAWSTRGRTEPPRLQSFSLTAGHSVLLPVADYVPDAGLITLHVHANSGRFTAQVRDNRVDGVRAGGADWIPPTQPPATRTVVPGFPGGPGSRQLILTNPGSREATVGLRISATGSSFVPAGHQQVVVSAGHSTYIDLTEALAGQRAAVLLTSDVPVTAVGLAKLDTGGGALPDLQWQPATAPLTTPAVFASDAPPFGSAASVILTAPAAAATVRITAAGGRSSTVDVPAGRTVGFYPIAELGPGARGAVVVTPMSGGPVYVSRSLYAAGAHGPLVTSTQPVPVAAPVTLPPAVADPTAAVR